MDFNCIDAMSRDDFLEKIVRNIGKRRDFAKVVAFGAENTDAEAKTSLRYALKIAGIGDCLTDDDEKLNYAVGRITARSVQLR